MAKSKIVAVGGVPGVGKSTVVKGVFDHLGTKGTLCKGNKLVYHEIRHANLVVLGNYTEDQSFPGTDRLPMDVMVEALTFIRSTKCNVLFEGDRLFCGAFLKACKKKHDLSPYVVVAMRSKIDERRRSRGGKQNSRWLKGRETKVSNISDAYSCKRIPNNTPEDLKKCVSVILTDLGLIV